VGVVNRIERFGAVVVRGRRSDLVDFINFDLFEIAPIASIR
jgi:hypothetical protein